MIYSDYNYVVYSSEKGETTKPILKSDKLSNEFLSMQYADFIDEGDRVRLSLFENTGALNNNVLAEIAEIVCAQFNEIPGTSQLDAEYFTTMDQMKIIALNVEPRVMSIKFQIRDNIGKVISESIPMSLEEFDLEANKLIFVIDSNQETENLSPILHEYSTVPHNNILDKIVTLKSVSDAMKLLVIEGTYNNQANIALGDKLKSYKVRVNSYLSTYKGRLLINRKEIND